MVSLQRINHFFERIYAVGFKEEFIQVAKIAWPAVLTSFLQFFLQTVSIIMCGHLAKAKLDAVGLANSMINVFGLSIGMGMSTACDTFFSQTFGSGNKKKVGAYLQKSLLIMNMTAVLICCIHINIEPILLVLGQNPEIIQLTETYMLCFLPGIFFDYNYLVIARYLQNQNILYPSLVCALFGNAFNIISQYISIYVFNFSYLSSAVCQAISFFVMMVTQIIYIFYSKVYKDTWDGIKLRDLLGDWGLFAKLAIPGIFLIGLEEWSFEIATFVSGTIDTIELGIQTILFQVETLCYMIPLGLSIAVNIRVGQHLGANQPERAKCSYRVGLTISLITATTIASICLAFREYIPMIFTKNNEIVAGASAVLVLNAGFQYGDGIAATSAGALRGCGRQLTGAIILFIGYYIISLPIGICLALLTSFKVFGLWIGLLVGITLEAVIFVILVNLTDWKLQCKKANMVAYGTCGDREKVLRREEEIDQLIANISDLESIASNSEEEPLLGRRRRHRSSRMRNSITASISKRAAVDPITDDIPENDLTEQAFRKVVFNRIVTIVLLLLVVAGAITMRIMKPQRCFQINNSTMNDYIGILPPCNDSMV